SPARADRVLVGLAVAVVVLAVTGLGPAGEDERIRVVAVASSADERRMPSPSASRIENSQTAVAGLQRTLVLQGSSAKRSWQNSSSEQTMPATQPLPTSQCWPAPQAVAPSFGPGTCRQAPKAQLSTVHGMPSSQSAAVSQVPS